MSLLEQAKADAADRDEERAATAQASRDDRFDVQLAAEFVCKRLARQVTADDLGETILVGTAGRKLWHFGIDEFRFEVELTVRGRAKRLCMWTLVPVASPKGMTEVRGKVITRLADLVGEGER